MKFSKLVLHSLKIFVVNILLAFVVAFPVSLLIDAHHEAIASIIVGFCLCVAFVSAVGDIMAELNEINHYKLTKFIEEKHKIQYDWYLSLHNRHPQTSQQVYSAPLPPPQEISKQ